MKIEQAIDWNRVNGELRTQLSTIAYNPDLHRIQININTMVSDLSKLEVECRRRPHDSRLVAKVEEINQAIDRLEKLILMAKLMS